MITMVRKGEGRMMIKLNLSIKDLSNEYSFIRRISSLWLSVNEMKLV
jgi:hypothetical protein